MPAGVRLTPQNPEIHTRVTPEMKAKIQAMAAANDRSVSAELQRAVRMYVTMMDRKAAQDYREVDRG